MVTFRWTNGRMDGRTFHLSTHRSASNRLIISRQANKQTSLLYLTLLYLKVSTHNTHTNLKEQNSSWPLSRSEQLDNDVDVDDDILVMRLRTDGRTDGWRLRWMNEWKNEKCLISALSFQLATIKIHSFFKFLLTPSSVQLWQMFAWCV